MTQLFYKQIAGLTFGITEWATIETTFVLKKQVSYRLTKKAPPVRQRF